MGGKGGGYRGGGAGNAGDGEEPQVDMDALMSDWEGKMVNSIDLLKQNLGGIRAGKATPALLEGIRVSAYESEVGITEVAMINVLDTTTLSVNCYDETVAPAVEKAIMSSGLGYSVSPSGSTVKVGIPTLTKDKREQYAKVARDYAEKTRVGVRNVRAAAMKKVKGLSKSLSEDVVKGLQSDIENLVKKNIGECDRMIKQKEEQILKG